MIVAPGANDAFAAADGNRLAAALAEAPARSVLVLDTELAPAALEPALAAARTHGRRCVLDPTRPAQLPQHFLELADHVTPNADEAAQLTGVAVSSPRDARRAARRLREGGAQAVHVRLPRGGCLTLWSGGEALISVPEDLQAVDTTGAGDAFAATLASALVADYPVLRAASLAVAAAACAVGGFGAQESYPDRARVEAMAERVAVTPM
jgi:ribokinase